MNIMCDYATDKGCALVYAVCGEWRIFPANTCYSICGPNDTKKQINILKKYFGVDVKLPENEDLLEWVRKEITSKRVIVPERIAQPHKQQAEQAKAIAELPSWFAQLKNLRRHAKEIAAYKLRTGRILVTFEWKTARLAKCDECDKLWVNPKSGHKRCSGCGCHLEGLVGEKYGKADFAALSCERWEPIDSKYKELLK